MLIELQILTTFITILWLDVFRINPRVLKLLRFKPWATKLDLPFLLKWLACYFCTCFWIGIGVGFVSYLNSVEIQTVILLIMLNTIVALVFDRLLNK